MQQPMRVWALPGMPEVHEGDGLVPIILSAGAATGPAMRDGDILVVTSEIVSKAEGRSRPAAERAQAIGSETVRVVAVRDQTRIVENRLGIVGAAAGVDASNVAAGTVHLLPEGPD
ncbi:coenzyme F420-0:L-glutamate ligase [Microbacterium sp. CIAB417]|uniref:coenzyme F420-0:L-glutamate ligase n=1 Tax=Microbacterium sp. CIAB417 TaxID=2860287 RepID=UPI0027E2A8D4|nr:coenzyme F420-0:L-glutamate ligase [Microbacterium sp. CIAB417]